MTLKKTIHDNTMETSPYSAVGNIPVYNRTNKKLNIRGKTVASPYMAVCLKRFLYNPNGDFLFVKNKNN
jgi:hypothetical protein